MHSLQSISPGRAARRSAPVTLWFTCLLVLMPACLGDRDLEPTPDVGDIPSDMDDSRSDNVATGSPSATTMPGSRFPDAALATVDAAAGRILLDGATASPSAAPSSDGGRGRVAMDGALLTESAGNPDAPSAWPARDSGAPSARDSGGPNALDGGAPVLPPDATSAEAQPLDEEAARCGVELTICLLADLSDLDLCLEQFSTCVAVFSGDAGQQAACATRYAACVLRDPLGFANCQLDLNCEVQPSDATL